LAVPDAELPQVWLPGSSHLLARARDLGATGVPAAGRPIAGSPVVLALTQEAAERFGAGDARPRWPDVLAEDGVTVGIPDPTRDVVGLAALLEARGISRSAPDPQLALTATLRTLAGRTVVGTADLYDQLPGRDVDDPVTAFPTAEQALLQWNAAHPDQPLTASYPAVAPVALDYPFTVLDTATPEQRTAADALVAALLDPAGQAVLAEAGFRTPDGRMLHDHAADGHTVDIAPTPVPLTGSSAVPEVLERWAAVTRSARARVLIDVSGSMDADVPGLGGTRLEATLQAAERGLRLFRPTTRLGYWAFSTNLDGERDHREVWPISPVSELLDEPALSALRGIEVDQQGRTGLYDTVLAAVAEGRRNWESGRLNLVIVMTDGNNDDRSSISRQELLQELRSGDPRRPVVVIGVAIGPDVDPGELAEIAEATGGRSFVAPDPGRISDVFIGALATLQGD
ncbi:MAG TPA: substrate-binding domain-containing protein, partial [Pseudonocardia sp.]|nr:substrate-binding domain-containing protein [Pseudonocardia sp.]